MSDLIKVEVCVEEDMELVWECWKDPKYIRKFQVICRKFIIWISLCTLREFYRDLLKVFTTFLTV